MRACRLKMISDELTENSIFNSRNNSSCVSGKIVGQSGDKRAPCNANSKSTFHSEKYSKLEPNRDKSIALTRTVGRQTNFYANQVIAIAFVNTYKHGQVQYCGRGAGVGCGTGCLLRTCIP